MIDQGLKFLSDNAGILGTALGILVFIVKAVSNKKADPFMAKLQAIFDKLPEGIDKVGTFLKAICTMLSKALKSDGFLGKE